MEGSLPHIKQRRWKHKLWENPELESYQQHLKTTRHLKHHYEQKVQMLADYGSVRSHLSDKYPECVPYVYRRGKKEAKE